MKLRDGFQGQRAFVLPPATIKELRENPLSATLHFTDIGYYPHASHHFRERPQGAAEHIFIYCTRGRGWFSVGDTTFPVGADSYFIIPADTPHAYGAAEDDPWSIYWIHFSGSLSSLYLPKRTAPVEIKPGALSRIADRLGLFEEMINTIARGYEMDNLMYACSVFHHFLGSLSYLRAYRNIPSADQAAPNALESAIKFMKENIEKKLTLGEIAAYAGYSTSQLSLIFRTHAGLPPMEYLNRLKIRHACYLLDFTDMKVNQICHKTGISDPYYFSRLFHTVMGVSPRDYRRREKG
ncbi:MAG: helix-turn-helix domain-containing protein [Bacteroides sp.]|nr:helix-turn-helix domain-containing protein [Bacteroides sp.]